MENKAKIIVARYDENINWLIPLENYCIIYNKGQKLNLKNEIMMDNVGRETDTYLNYIINNYDNLPEVMAFIQGKLSDIRGADDIRIVIQMINEAFQYKKSKAYRVYHSTSVNKGNWDPYWNKKNDGLYYLHDNYKDNKRVGFKDWFTEHIKKEYPNPIHLYCNGIFAVHKDLILKHSREYYKNLLLEVNHQNNPAEGHFFERSWYYIFE